jgi:sulfur-oxidizing protein SoxB
LTLNGTPLSADKRYKVAGWAPVSEEARLAGGEPIWELMARYLRGQKTIPQRKLNVPKLVGVAGNSGLA